MVKVDLSRALLEFHACHGVGFPFCFVWCDGNLIHLDRPDLYVGPRIMLGIACCSMMIRLAAEIK